MTADATGRFSLDAFVGSVVAIATSLLVLLLPARGAIAQEDWVIRSFDARYVVVEDGSVAASEDILVEFGSLERHGIYRDIPVEYRFDAASNRLISITGVWVDDGTEPVPFESSRQGANLRIKIGDPGRLVTGEQRYRISYTINNGLNPFVDHDELFWNATGNGWPVVIERASAKVELPAPGVTQVACFAGPSGSVDPCESSSSNSTADFRTRADTLQPGSGLTFVVGIKKGLIDVGQPALVDADEDPLEQAADFLGLNPWSIALSAAVFVAALCLLVWRWWMVGRDRWFGDNYYFTDEAPPPEIKPLFSNETIVVEFEPPDLKSGRRLRPAEVGLLLDEKADTLDVSATIVDLAVRKFIRIEERAGKDEYELIQLEKPAGDVLEYEQKLLNALFRDGDKVLLSDLKNEFHEDLAKVKSALYEQGVARDKFFPRDPEGVRGLYGLSGAAIAIGGAALVWFLGTTLDVGLIGVPVAAAGGLLAVGSAAMPRRTALGRQMYRRCLGLRTFMLAGDQGRERFAEDQNIFEEYLPYAIVFRSAKQWAQRFEDLGIEPQTSGWYVGTGAFMPTRFATDIRSFSDSLGGVMASTPGGSGGSGFSGGGFSGGGGGGGGGGSW